MSIVRPSSPRARSIRRRTKCRRASARYGSRATTGPRNLIAGKVTSTPARRSSRSAEPASRHQSCGQRSSTPRRRHRPLSVRRFAARWTYHLTDDMQITYVAGLHCARRHNRPTPMPARFRRRRVRSGDRQQLYRGGLSARDQTVRSHYWFHQPRAPDEIDRQTQAVDCIFGGYSFAREQQHPLRRRPARRLSRWPHAAFVGSFIQAKRTIELAGGLRPARHGM